MKPKVIFLIGPPGSGKGTQAELLAKDLGFYHFEISKVIEEKFKNADSRDKEITHQKEHWISGELVHQELVAKWFLEKVEELKDQVQGFVFSGSARAVDQAEKELNFLSKIYGKENIMAVEIKLSEEESIKRNSARRICKENRHPIPNFPEYADLKVCPEDGSEVITRELDKPDIIKERYQVYLKETAPVIDYFRENGYKVMEIDGEQPIEDVFQDIKLQITSIK
ncbi:MAG: adenylate kinase [Parcubacteria group bacterium Gr01-1014_2]|nr:MAG: adenylate kinase [Parcubacteria group bacterium Gr01-1014_2]